MIPQVGSSLSRVLASKLDSVLLPFLAERPERGVYYLCRLVGRKKELNLEKMDEDTAVLYLFLAELTGYPKDARQKVKEAYTDAVCRILKEGCRAEVSLSEEEKSVLDEAVDISTDLVRLAVLEQTKDLRLARALAQATERRIEKLTQKLRN